MSSHRVAGTSYKAVPSCTEAPTSAMACNTIVNWQKIVVAEATATALLVLISVLSVVVATHTSSHSQNKHLSSYQSSQVDHSIANTGLHKALQAIHISNLDDGNPQVVIHIF
jgi:hypothetical protein